MKRAPRMIVWLAALALVLSLAVPVVAAQGLGSGEKAKADSGHKAGNDRHESGAQRPGAGQAACSDTQSTVASNSGASEGTQAGSQTSTQTGVQTGTDTSAETSTEAGTETATDASTQTVTDASTQAEQPQQPCTSSSAKASVNLTGRGKSAEHNPNVDANGQLIPGSVADQDPADIAAREEQETEHIKRVKDDSRAKAREERQRGEKDAYLVYVDGKRLNLTPLAKGGRTLVPFRRLAETLGAEVTWDPSTRTVTMVKDGNTVVLTIGASTATVNGKEVILQVPSEIVEGSTFVPLRFIAEALGADVDFDGTTGAITVISPTTGTTTGTTTETTTGTTTETTIETTTGTSTGN